MAVTARKAPRVMKESAAWREVGRRIEKREGLRLGALAGLCNEMAQLRYEGLVPDNRSFDYGNPRIAMHLGGACYAYHGEEWEARCLAAYWMALEAAEEGK